MQTSSLEGYGAPIIDIGHWWVGADYARVVGTMRNFMPERMVRATGQHDADEHRRRRHLHRRVHQRRDRLDPDAASSPSATTRVSKRASTASRARSSADWSRSSAWPRRSKLATPDAVEFDELEIPQRFYPPAGTPRESWRIAVLRQPDQRLPRRDRRRRRPQPGQLRGRRLGPGSRSTRSSCRSTNGAGSICHWHCTRACC